jgi:hypothetical protein
MFLLL